jgi:hypothetical protein
MRAARWLKERKEMCLEFRAKENERFSCVQIAKGREFKIFVIEAKREPMTAEVER